MKLFLVLALVGVAAAQWNAPLCAVNIFQSPVDLSAAAEGTTHDPWTRGAAVTAQNLALKTGAIEFSSAFQNDGGNWVNSVTGGVFTLNSREFPIVGVRVATPAAHKIEGDEADLELQLTLGGDYERGRQRRVSILYNGQGTSNAAGWDSILNSATSADLSNIIPSGAQDFYGYRGSSEKTCDGTTWYVYRYVQTISVAQLGSFQTKAPSGAHEVRPIQTALRETKVWTSWAITNKDAAMTINEFSDDDTDSPGADEYFVIAIICLSVYSLLLLAFAVFMFQKAQDDIKAKGDQDAQQGKGAVPVHRDGP